MKVDTFSFTGCMITKLENGDIQIYQKEYASKVEINDIPEGPSKRMLNEKEKKQYREYIGKLNWLSQLTDPTISFLTHEYSTRISSAKVEDLKKLRRLLILAKENPKEIVLRKLSDDPYNEDIRILVYSDASHTKRDGVGNSVNGRISFIVNTKTGQSNPLEWKTKKLARVCRSIKTAEAISAEENSGRGSNFGVMYRELLTGIKKKQQSDLMKSPTIRCGKSEVKIIICDICQKFYFFIINL